MDSTSFVDLDRPCPFTHLNVSHAIAGVGALDRTGQDILPTSSSRIPVFSHMSRHAARMILMLKDGVIAFRCLWCCGPSDKINPKPMTRARKLRTFQGFSTSYMCWCS